MAVKKLKIGIIGCGGIANGKHMPSLKLLPDVSMVAFCDIIEERAIKAAKDYGTADAKVYTDYRKLLEDKTIDIVHVLTPNKEHSEISVAALNADKHVMCEKPMAKSYAEAQKMLKAYQEAHKRSGKLLTIGYQSRHMVQSQTLKAICERGDLGEIYYAKALALRRRGVPTWGVFMDEEEQGGGPLIDIGTHALDLTLWLMDNYKPKSVMGNVYKKLRADGNCGNDFGPWDPKKFTVEDSAFGFITMQNGATISLESSWAINLADVREATTILCGTKGGADFSDGLRINGADLGSLYLRKVDTHKGGVAFYEGVNNGKCEQVEAARWINAVRKSKLPVVLPEQAIVVTQLLEAIYTSAKTGELVTF